MLLLFNVKVNSCRLKQPYELPAIAQLSSPYSISLQIHSPNFNHFNFIKRYLSCGL